MNEFSVNKNYNWQEGSELLVKKYVADLYQTGINAPVATELFNNTGLYFTYDYVTPGVYAVTVNKDIFSGLEGQKYQATITNATYVEDVAAPIGQSVTIFPVFTNVLIILTSDLTGPANGILGNNTQNAFELTVYP